MCIEYDYRKKVFATAKFCLSLKLDRKAIQATADLCGISNPVLVRACVILMSNSDLLRKLVELGYWSFLKAAKLVQKHDWFIYIMDEQLVFSKEQTERLEEQIRQELDQMFSKEYALNLIALFAVQGLRSEKNIPRLTEELSRLLEGILQEKHANIACCDDEIDDVTY